MRDGVTIQLPETVMVDPDVIVGEDTILEPTVQLLGKTRIGARCTIRTGSVLREATLGDDVLVEPHCVIDSSRLESEVILGPFARLRPESHLLKGAKVGNFVEIKKSTIGEGSKAHLLHRRRQSRQQIQHRRRHHHLQLRRLRQASHNHRQPRFVAVTPSSSLQ